MNIIDESGKPIVRTSPTLKGEAVNHDMISTLSAPTINEVVEAKVIENACSVTGDTWQAEESTALPANVCVVIVTVLPDAVVGGVLILVAVKTIVLPGLTILEKAEPSESYDCEMSQLKILFRDAPDTFVQVVGVYINTVYVGREFNQLLGNSRFIMPPASTVFLVVKLNVAVDYVKTVEGEKDTEQLARVSGVSISKVQRFVEYEVPPEVKL